MSGHLDFSAGSAQGRGLPGTAHLVTPFWIHCDISLFFPEGKCRGGRNHRLHILNILIFLPRTLSLKSSKVDNKVPAMEKGSRPRDLLGVLARALGLQTPVTGHDPLRPWWTKGQWSPVRNSAESQALEPPHLAGPGISVTGTPTSPWRVRSGEGLTPALFRLQTAPYAIPAPGKEA